MAVLVTCPTCQKSFRIRDELRASRIPCPHCHTDVTADGERVPDHDVFISYAQKDKHVADGICAVFEGRGVRCWIAPRDVPPGTNWGASIVKAIKDSRMMVLVFSASSNRSQQVLREVNAAVSAGEVIVPFRIEDVALSEDLEYYLSVPHWLDALTEPLDGHLKLLVGRVRAILEQGGHTVWCEVRTMDEATHVPAAKAPALESSTQQAAPNDPSSSSGTSPIRSALSERLERLRKEDERKREELEEAECRHREEPFELLQKKLMEELDREAFDEAWKTVMELRKLKPDDTEVQEATKLIAEQMGHRGAGAVLTLPGGVTMEFVLIPPGTFMMGSPGNEPGRNSNEGPQHQVTIAYPFWLGKYPVTQAQWQAVMGTSVTDQRNKVNPTFGLAGLGPNFPMYFVSWYECQEFNQKVNTMGQGVFRLPSEAEWEYSCRTGAQTRYCFGDNEAELGEYAWSAANSDLSTHPVGQKKANTRYLYDMHGNVWEWCQDCLHATYTCAPANGRAWESPSSHIRVIRGGSWNNRRPACRSASRGGGNPNGRYDSHGFRLVRDQF